MDDAGAASVDPAWERLGPRLRAHPAGPPGGARPWRALVIGFGRGFEAVALERRLRAEAPEARLELTGLEPQPESLEPWPPRWHELLPGEAPWWGARGGDWPQAGGARRVRIEAVRAAAWLRAAPARSLDLILLDLYSPAHAPEDWEPGLWEGLAAAAAPGAVLAGYCCARRVRDGLREAGWEVEVLRKPGRRDTLRAGWPPAAQP